MTHLVYPVQMISLGRYVCIFIHSQLYMNIVPVPKYFILYSRTVRMHTLVIPKVTGKLNRAIYVRCVFSLTSLRLMCNLFTLGPYII
jgi:hypothetical protein